MLRKICYCLLVLLLACHDGVDLKQADNPTVEEPIVFRYPKKFKGTNIDKLCTGTIDLAPEIVPKGLSSLTIKIEPPLPQGLSISDTGIISGQIAGVYQGRHTVTLYKSGEEVSSDLINLQMEAVDNIKHYSASYTLQKELALPDSLFSQDEALDGLFTYSVQPELPEGLTISSSDGKISGTPAQVMDFQEYTLTVRSHACENTFSFRLTVSLRPNQAPVFSETSENTNYYMPVALKMRDSGLVQNEFMIARISGFEDPEGDTLRYRLVSNTHHNADVSDFVIDGDKIKLMVDITKIHRLARYVYLSKYTREDLVIEAIDILENKTTCTVSINRSNKFSNSTLSGSEILPAGWQDNVLTQQQIASLPNLTKPKSDYRLVLAEEFDYPSTNGSNGLENLDENIWGGNSSSRKEPGSNRYCRQVKNGTLQYRFSHYCRDSEWLTTRFKMEYRYGYIEMKSFYPLVQERSSEYYTNFAVVLWSRYGGSQDGVAINNDGVLSRRREPIRLVDVRSYLRAGGYEIDLFEYVFGEKKNYSHWYAAHGDGYRTQINAPAVKIDRNTEFCRVRNLGRPTGDFRLANCNVTRSGYRPERERYVAYTRGIEWTPRGYREFYRYETGNSSDDSNPKLNEPLQTVKSNVYRLSTGDYSQSFNIVPYLHDKDTPDQLLELAVLHQPVFLAIYAWGYPPNDGRKIGYRQVKHDYVRLYKPVDNYTDVTKSHRWILPALPLR